MKVQQIFTPNDIPTVTYVDRSEHKLEQKIRDYYETPNLVVSVSGPSKSGKTVLIKKVVPYDLLIPVVGAGIASADNLWDRVLNWMGSPTEISNTKSVGNEISAGAEATGKIKIPIVAEGGASGSVSGTHSTDSSRTQTFRRGGLEQVIKEISQSEYVVFHR